MKLHFLGTGVPSQFEKSTSTQKENRRISSLLVNSTLLIDPGADIFRFEKEFSLDGLYDEVEGYICTQKEKGYFSKMNAFKLHGHEKRVGEFKSVKDELYEITAYPCNNFSAKKAKSFEITDLRDGRRIFYSGACSLMPGETAQAIESKRFDVMVFDAGAYSVEGDPVIFVHNNYAMIAQLAKIFSKKADRIILNNIGCTGELTHEQLCEQLDPLGVFPAFDNMIIEL